MASDFFWHGSSSTRACSTFHLESTEKSHKLHNQSSVRKPELPNSSGFLTGLVEAQTLPQCSQDLVPRITHKGACPKKQPDSRHAGCQVLILSPPVILMLWSTSLCRLCCAGYLRASRTVFYGMGQQCPYQNSSPGAALWEIPGPGLHRPRRRGRSSWTLQLGRGRLSKGVLIYKCANKPTYSLSNWPFVSAPNYEYGYKPSRIRARTGVP